MVLELKGVTHRYGTHIVLQNVDLTLAPGERIAIMGPSGRGKTTLLRIALGLMEPTEGAVRNTFARTGAVFQEPRLLPWRTALENVNLVLADDKTTLEQAKYYLELVGLGDALGKYPRELSGGMQQRTALARALAVEGDFLVLDEPFKALDEALHCQILELVGKTKAAVLLVTHDAEEAERLGCRVVQI